MYSRYDFLSLNNETDPMYLVAISAKINREFAQLTRIYELLNFDKIASYFVEIVNLFIV